jgi:hypothetical protein
VSDNVEKHIETDIWMDEILPASSVWPSVILLRLRCFYLKIYLTETHWNYLMFFRQIIVFYSENYSNPLKHSMAKMWCCGMLRKTVHMVSQECTNRPESLRKY